MALDLRGNSISDTGVQYLAEILNHNKVVIPKFSFFLNNYIITYTQTLKNLSLGFNIITDKGAKHLADALVNNTVMIISIQWISSNHFHVYI